jgi:hypothetical protein
MYEMTHLPLLVFLALYLAHLIADFPFQTSWIVHNKHKATAIAIHAAIHFGISALLLALFTTTLSLVPRTYWVLGLLVIAHLLIDKAKYWITTERMLPDNSRLFLADQFLHLITVGAVSLYLTRTHLSDVISQVTVSDLTKRNILAIGVIYVGVVFAGGYLIRYVTKPLAGNISSHNKESITLQNAGLYIGWLERFLVLTAIVVQSPAMVGLILTGKSIARFPDLKEPHFAEYFLIGTLLSISIALMGGLILANLLWGTASLK